MPETLPLFRRLEAAVQSVLDAAGAPGATLAARVDGQALFAVGFGKRLAGSKRPIAPDAKMYLYSITKPLIAAVVLRHVARGRLGLDAPVQEQLGDLPWPSPLTVRALLSHTAGLPDYGGYPPYVEALRAHPEAPWTSEEFLSLLDGRLPPPQAAWAYSNLGYLLLRLLLEHLESKPLSAILADTIFAPLGLTAAFVATGFSRTPELSPGHEAENGVLYDAIPTYHPGWVSHGVVVSNAAGTARLFEALFDGTLLSPESRTLMETPVAEVGHHPKLGRLQSGLGVFLAPESPWGPGIGHPGGGPGYSPLAYRFTLPSGRHLTLAAMVNRSGAELGHDVLCAAAEALAAEWTT